MRSASGAALRHRFEAGIAHRAEHMGDAEFGRRLDHRLGAAGMKAFQRADRAKHDRQPQLLAEHFGRGIDLADVAQHARPERDRVERHAVAPQRRLGLGAADDVVPIVLVEIGAGFGDELVQVVKFARRRGVGAARASSWFCVGFWLVIGWDSAVFSGWCSSLLPDGRVSEKPSPWAGAAYRAETAVQERKNAVKN